MERSQTTIAAIFETMDYGQTEFGIKDYDGYTLAFAEALEGGARGRP